MSTQRPHDPRTGVKHQILDRDLLGPAVGETPANKLIEARPGFRQQRALMQNVIKVPQGAPQEQPASRSQPILKK